MRILAVDDDTFILDLLPVVLANCGYDDIETCASAEAALDMISQARTPYDCLFLDIRMDGMDGSELCQLIRARPEYRNTPIIMLTAQHDRENVERAFRAGATDYVTKPFDIIELGARVRVAQKLIEAQAPVRRPLRATHPATDDPSKPPFADPVDLRAGGSVVTAEALENYMHQLSRNKVQTATIFGIKLEGADELHARLETPAFLRVLENTSAAMARALAAHGVAFLAYAGSGIFQCILTAEPRIAAARIEGILQAALDALEPELPAPMLALIGEPLRPRPTHQSAISPRVLRVAFARAQARFTPASKVCSDWPRARLC